jgi:uncharacterized tellurite resistance protein B-like protein
MIPIMILEMNGTTVQRICEMLGISMNNVINQQNVLVVIQVDPE